MSLSIKEKKVIKELVKVGTEAHFNGLEHTTDEMKNNPEFVISALKALVTSFDKYRGNATKMWYAKTLISDSLKKNDDFMKEVIGYYPYALCCASDKLRSDKEVVLKAVKKCGDTLMFAVDELRSDEEVVMAAVRNDPSAFTHALGAIRDRLSSDKKVVLAAVKNKGLALRYASEELRSDKEVVLAAVKQDRHALEYASDNLRRDPDILSVCIKKDWYITIHKWCTGKTYQQLKEDPRFAKYFEMNDTLENLRAKKIKLDQINDSYFTDSIFYDRVVYIMKDLVKERFEKLTADMSDQEILDQKLQKTLNKRIEQMYKKLESKRNLVKFKQKVNHILHKDKASDLDKALDDLGV